MSKNNLEDYVLSDKNIYIAIYSVKSYVFEPGLLSTDDKKLLNMLQDPFDEKIIFQVIKEVKNIIEKIIKDESNLFEVQVYFKPKKYEDGKEIFRPIHTADLKSLIAMAALLNVLIYDTSDDRIKLSNYSRLIPNNFYGNRVSDNPEQLYKKWNIQYKEYTQRANDYLKKYYESGEYKYEIKMDIKNFFPSVNPLLVYAMLLENMPVTLSKNDEKIFKTIIYKLLICKVTNINTKKAKKLYYDTFIDKNSYTRGLPQGLPQSYFFGNVCMTRIAQIVNDNFEGKAVYYVDDSYVYTNYKLEDKIGEINKKIKDIASEYINRISDSDAFVRQANFPNFQNVLDNKETYLIHIYDEGKSTCTEIKHCKEGEIYLRMLSREASQISNDIKSSYSDEEDLTMLNKAETLLNSIECEMGLDNLDSGYKEKLERYYKFFKYRTIRLRLKTERGLSKTLFDVFDNTLKIDSKNNTDDRYRKLSEGDVDIKKFFESYKSDIWAVAIELIITNTISKQELNYVSEYISNVISAIYEKDLMACSYMKKVYESYMNSDEIHSTTDPYSTLNQIINRKMMRFTNLNSEVLSQEFEGIKLKGIKENILSSFDICSEEFIDACYIVNNSTNRLKRMFLNAVYSKVFKVSISDDIVIGSYDKKGITYGALRILVYLRNQLCDIDEFFIWNMELKSRDNLQKVDYALFEVLGAYKKYVINAQYIDNLIMIHKYTCDVWKNGAKHLYFYTLHNQEHAIDLVKNIIKIIKVISYFKISYYDYYILFITCYLHDIAMVRIAADDEFLLDEYKSNEIATEYAHKWKDADDNDIKKLILDIYKELDQFFEDRIRSNHAKNSAAEIRTRHELDFLEPSVRENIAKIAENHIADVKNVYFVKGDAQNSLISYKFDMILLRIADLLDMSERRISKPILNHNIDNMSKESAFHWISHLLTENYTLVSKYENGYAKDTDSYLAPGNMIERVELTIFVDMSQFSKIQTGGCRYCKIDENTISPYGFDIYMLNGESEVCDGKKCNFLCKWFNKKNDYLVQEMQALEQYLGRIPKNNKLYKTEIVIKVRVNNTSCIPKEQFEILREVIEEKKQ